MNGAPATFFGGPDDGRTIILSEEDLARGFIDTMDSLGHTIRHTVIKLDQAKQVDDMEIDYELRPTEGVW